MYHVYVDKFNGIVCQTLPSYSRETDSMKSWCGENDPSFSLVFRQVESFGRGSRLQMSREKLARCNSKPSQHSRCSPSLPEKSWKVRVFFNDETSKYLRLLSSFKQFNLPFDLTFQEINEHDAYRLFFPCSNL